MTGVASGEAAIELPRPARAARQRVDAASAAWLLTIPCAAVAAAAVLLLGPPLGRLFLSPHASFTFFPEAALSPKPTEEARYLVALSAPVLLALAIVAAMRRRLELRPRVTAGAVAVVQALAAAFVAACVVAQHGADFTIAYFSPATLAVAGGLTLVLLTVLRSAWIRARAAALLRETRPRHAAALLAAAAMTAVWVLPAINSDRSIAWAHFTAQFHVAFSLDETFAVLNGLTPLVDFSAQYGSLWPFAAALSMLAFGKTLLVYSITMSTITALAMLAVYGVLRRAARSAIAALLLFAPFLASSFFRVDGTLAVRHEFGTYFPMYPVRFGGPYLLAWLIARHLDGRGRAPPWPLFLLAGLVMINNTDFGVPAFGATIAALACTRLVWRRRPLVRFAGAVALGLAGALALVSALTLVRAGSLPDLGRVVEFARIYGVAGFNALRLPEVLGLPLVIYLTHVAAIGVAVVRAVRREPNRALTGMLAWAGVFGLGSADYYMARSYYEVMPYLFSVWALTLGLLAIVVVRQLAAHPSRRPGIAGIAVLFGVGVTVCSLAQTPIPWGQLHRISTPPAGSTSSNEPYMPPSGPGARRFVSSLADGPHRFVLKPGAPVALFMTTGHRTADAYGIADVTPYTGVESVDTIQQLDRVVAALRDAGGNTIVMPDSARGPVLEALAERGFAPLTSSGLRPYPHGGQARGFPGPLDVEGLTKWVDLHHLHPRALR